MASFSDVLVIYVTIGVVMWGGGALELSETGPVDFFVDEGDDGQIETEADAEDTIDEQVGVVSTVVNLAVGAIMLVVNLVADLLGFIHWPIIALANVNAPPAAVATLGVPMTASFYVSVVGLFWRAS